MLLSQNLLFLILNFLLKFHLVVINLRYNNFVWRSDMYIVTGGAGFIGSVMVWKLNQQGIDDIIIVDKLRKEDKWKNLTKKSN